MDIPADYRSVKFFGGFFTKDIENYDVVKEVEKAVSTT